MRLSTRYCKIMLVLAAWLCFLPIPPVVQFINASYISLALTIVLGPSIMIKLSKKFNGKWCFASVFLIIVFLELPISYFNNSLTMNQFLFITFPLGPMFLIMYCLTTNELLGFTVNTVMIMIITSIIFALAIYIFGDTFFSMKLWLLSTSDSEILDYNAYVKFASGLRGSGYMFGYDLILLFGFLFGRTINTSKSAPITAQKTKLTSVTNTFIMYFVILLDIFAMQINLERMPFISMFVLILFAMLKKENVKDSLKMLFFISIVSVSALYLVNYFSGGGSLLRRLQGTDVETFEMRMELLRCSWEAIIAQPFSPMKYYGAIAPLKYGNPNLPHVHFITVLVKDGILVLPILMYVIYQIINTIVHYFKYEQDQVRLMIMLAFVGYMVNGLVHNPGPWLGTASGVFILALLGKSLEIGPDSRVQ
jgi:hypothetical protein